MAKWADVHHPAQQAQAPVEEDGAGCGSGGEEVAGASNDEAGNGGQGGSGGGTLIHASPAAASASVPAPVAASAVASTVATAPTTTAAATTTLVRIYPPSRAKALSGYVVAGPHRGALSNERACTALDPLMRGVGVCNFTGDRGMQRKGRWLWAELRRGNKRFRIAIVRDDRGDSMYLPSDVPLRDRHQLKEDVETALPSMRDDRDGGDGSGGGGGNDDGNDGGGGGNDDGNDGGGGGGGNGGNDGGGSGANDSDSNGGDGSGDGSGGGTDGIGGGGTDGSGAGGGVDGSGGMMARDDVGSDEASDEESDEESGRGDVTKGVRVLEPAGGGSLPPLRLPQVSDVETREPDESPALHAEYGPHRVHPGVYAIPNFAQHVLGVQPGVVFNQMVDGYPVRKAGDAIDPKIAGWVDGANKALHYRGRPIKRCKLFAQRDPTTEGYRKYHYTGRQWTVMAAQVDVKRIPELEAMADKYDGWCDNMGYPRPDHYIVTWYEDGTYSIDWHYDKLPDILEGSLITIVKLGDHARRFALRRRLFLKASSTFKWVQPSDFPKDSPERKEAEKQLEKQKAASAKLQAAQEAIFDEPVAPGTAIIMTVRPRHALGSST